MRDGAAPIRRRPVVVVRRPDLAFDVIAVTGTGREPVVWDLFFLIPTGRARMLQADEMPPEQYEATLNWLYDLQARSPFPVKQNASAPA